MLNETAEIKGRGQPVVCIYCETEQTHRVCQSCWDLRRYAYLMAEVVTAPRRNGADPPMTAEERRDAT